MSDENKPLRLTKKKRKYVNERLKGKTKKDAALAAGYSEATSRNASSHIETPDVKADFQRIMRQYAPQEKIAKVINEGLEAKETKFFQKDGHVVEQVDVIAWSERRQYAAMAAEMGGYFIPRQELTIQDVNANSARSLESLLTRAVEKARNVSESSGEPTS